MLVKKVLFLIFGLILVCGTVPAFAATITAEAFDAGQGYPLPEDMQKIDPSAEEVTIVQNGDFAISQENPYIPDPVTAPNDPYNNRGYMVGDGINEDTDWTFDFTQDSAYSGFDFNAPLTSAVFNITLVPMGAGVDFDSDNFRIKWLEPIRLTSFDPEQVAGADNLVPLSFSVDVLGYFAGDDAIADNREYTSENILSLLSSGNGTLGMRYNSDAYVTYASLALTNDDPVPVPEPATMALLLPALFGLAAFKKRS